MTIVPYGTSSITLTPTAEDADAKIKVDDEAVTSGDPSLAIPLGMVKQVFKWMLLQLCQEQIVNT